MDQRGGEGAHRELLERLTAGSSPEHNRKALEYIASGAVLVADLITLKLPLEKGVEVVTGGTAIKVTIEP